jgi:hypothetical protein
MGVYVRNDVLTPVCYGGNFAVASSSMVRVSEDVFGRILHSLSRGGNIIEGGFAGEGLGSSLHKTSLKKSQNNSYEVFSWFPKFAFKCNLCRYTTTLFPSAADATRILHAANGDETVGKAVFISCPA